MRYQHLRNALPLLLSEAVSGLLVLRGRLFLAVAGIAAGSACVVALMNIGQSASSDTAKQFSKLNTDAFTVALEWEEGSGRPDNLFMQVFGSEPLSSGKAWMAPAAISQETLKKADDELYYSVIGSIPSLRQAASLTLESGRFLSGYDAGEHYAVVGTHILPHAVPDAEGEGARILIGAYWFLIIGVLAPVPEAPYGSISFNDAVIVPLETLSSAGKSDRISTLFAKALRGVNVTAYAEKVKAQAEAWTGLQSANVVLPAMLIESIARQESNLRHLLLALSLITLTGGGIGVMNTMVMNVSLRKQEIGLRMAVGASRTDIFLLFLTETLVLSLTGALSGVLVGSGFALLWALASGGEMQQAQSALWAGGGSAILIGTISGLWPAVKASRMQPVEALREI